MAIFGFSRCQPSTELVSANLSLSSITLSDCIVVTCMRVQMSRHSRCVYWNTVGMIICGKALCSICIRYYLRHLPFVSLSVCVFVSGMIQQVVKVIDVRPHRRRAWTVQSSVTRWRQCAFPSNCACLGPLESTSQMASRSVQPFCTALGSRQSDQWAAAFPLQNW